MTLYAVEKAQAGQPRERISIPVSKARALTIMYATVRGYVSEGYWPTDNDNDKKLPKDVAIITNGQEVITFAVVPETRLTDGMVRQLEAEPVAIEAVSDYSVDVDATPTEGLFVDELADDYAAETAGV